MNWKCALLLYGASQCRLELGDNSDGETASVRTRRENPGFCCLVRLLPYFASPFVRWLGELARPVVCTLETVKTGVVALGNGSNPPVLKHGPRSLTCVRVNGWQTRLRNESNRWEICSIGRPCGSPRGLSLSIPVRTRKMVNYAWVG